MQGSRVCVLDVDNLRNEIIQEANYTSYSAHSGSTKMYHDVKDGYRWNGMNGDIADFVSKCLTCQKVKFEHQRPIGKLQEIPISE